MSYTLAIDSTSLNTINISLCSIKAGRNFELSINSRNSAETLIAGISKLLKSNSLDLQQIEKILVASGPGSFTGIRNALSTSFGLALGLKIDIFSTSILQIDAYLAAKDEHLLLLKRANNNEFFFQYFKFESKRIIEKTSVSIVNESEKASFIRQKLTELSLIEGNFQLIEIKQKSRENTAQGLIAFYRDNPEHFLQVFEHGTFKAKIAADYVKPVNAKTLAERGIC